MKDVVSKQCSAGKETVFEMQLKRSQFLVKNFTDDNITVKLGNNETYSTIGPKSWERVFNNDKDMEGKGAEAVDVVKVTAAVSGLVEVASLDY